MKKRLALLLSVMLVGTAVLSACGSNEEPAETTEETTEESTGEKELRVQIGPDPETIDPALNSASDGGNMIIHLMEGLLILDENGELQPGQAESYEVSEDGLTWTFTLRDGLKWSDGSDLTANDFVYTYKRLADPLTAAPYGETMLGSVKGFAEATAGDVDALGVSAPDDKTLVFELSAPCAYFADLASFATMVPVQEATVEANGEAWATTPETYISNGPFKMTEWVPGSHITMSKNENYWDVDAINLDKLTFVLMEDANAALSAYKNGDILMAKTVPTEEIPTLQEGDDFYVEPLIGTYYLSVNNTLPEFEDAKVRQALSLAIDRDFVANTLMQGTYSPAEYFIGDGWLDTDGTTEFKEASNGGEPFFDNSDFEANLEEAKKLLEEAGYPGGEGFPVITYSTNDSGYHKAVAEYLQQAWSELGLTVEVEIVEWSSFTPMRRSGDYQIARNGWIADYNDASNMLDLLYSTNGNNDGKYNNPAFDEQMDIARTTVDSVARSEALHAAEQIIMDEAAMIPVAYYNDFWVQSDKIEGSWHSVYGKWHFMYADIAE